MLDTTTNGEGFRLTCSCRSCSSKAYWWRWRTNWRRRPPDGANSENCESGCQFAILRATDIGRSEAAAEQAVADSSSEKMPRLVASRLRWIMAPIGRFSQKRRKLQSEMQTVSLLNTSSVEAKRHSGRSRRIHFSSLPYRYGIFRPRKFSAFRMIPLALSTVQRLTLP